MSEPDQIDQMDEHELRTELRSALLRLDTASRELAEATDQVTEQGDEIETLRSILSTALEHVIAAYYAPVGESGPLLSKAIHTLQTGDVENQKPKSEQQWCNDCQQYGPCVCSPPTVERHDSNLVGPSGGPYVAKD